MINPQHTITSPNPEYMVKKMIETVHDTLTSGDVFYYADEFNLN